VSTRFPGGLSRQIDFRHDEAAGDAYRMIGIPATVDNSTVSAIFETKSGLGEYDESWYRLFRWDPTSGTSGGYAEHPSPGFAIRPGSAFWFLCKDTVTLSTGSALSAPPADTARIDLEAGWNQISSPFLFPVRWPDNLWIDQVQPRGHRGSNSWAPDSTLRPWQGYFVRTDAALTVSIPAVDASQALNARPGAAKTA